ncbi:MAG: HAD-IA family hydrolase [Clostridiales bacterium]|nr:HAD-IA family hydrolase [Clostridiales bacterium]
MIKTIMMDCGGVVTYPLTGEWMMAPGLEELKAKYGFEIDEQLAREGLKKHLHFVDEGQLITGFKHEAECRIRFTRAMSEHLGVKLEDEDIMKMVRFQTYDDSKYQLYPDSVRMVNKLSRKYRVGFVSNAMPSMIRALINTGLCDELSFFTVSCLVGCQKPDEGIFLKALEEANANPEECVFVEDIGANLYAAGRLGIRQIRMVRDHYLTWPLPEFEWRGALAHDLEEVEELVDAHNSGVKEIPLCTE